MLVGVSNSPVLGLLGIAKTYPGGVRAVDGVDLELWPGEIHALVGENGAGKTTLASIAAGNLPPTAGTIQAHGSVGLVHQHFELVDRLRVWENVVLGIEPRCGLRIDEATARERVRALSQQNGLEVEPDSVVETLPVGIAQRVELLRALARDPTVLILDEPTAVLAPVEIEGLFGTIRALAARGTAILIITHKLQEVIAHTHRVTVMRAGKVVARYATGDTSVDQIARAMVGGELPALAPRVSVAPTPCFAAQDIEAGWGAQALRRVSLSVGSGEIVGIAGVEGNGQTSLADAIAGVLPYRGSIQLGDRSIDGLGPAQRLGAGVRTIAQDRQREALVLPWSIADNVVLGDHSRAPFGKAGIINRGSRDRAAQTIVDRFDVRTSSIRTPVAALSGGNQQKVVVGRALAAKPRLVVAYQPTRGIDVGAAALVQSQLIEARNAGVAVLLISFELDELFALADRVVVMYRGAIRGEFLRAAFDRSRIGALMAGAA